MKLVNEWLPVGKIRKVDTHFRIDSTCEKELMAALPLIGNSLHNSEMEYSEKFGHTLGRIHYISLLSRLDIFYATCRLETQTVAPYIHGLQGIKRCAQYLSSPPNKPIFYLSNYYDGSNFIRLKWIGNQVEYHTTQNCLEFNQYEDHAIIINRIRLVSSIVHTMLGVTV